MERQKRNNDNVKADKKKSQELMPENGLCKNAKHYIMKAGFIWLMQYKVILLRDGLDRMKERPNVYKKIKEIRFQ